MIGFQVSKSFCAIIKTRLAPVIHRTHGIDRGGVQEERGRNCAPGFFTNSVKPWNLIKQMEWNSCPLEDQADGDQSFGQCAHLGLVEVGLAHRSLLYQSLGIFPLFCTACSNQRHSYMSPYMPWRPVFNWGLEEATGMPREESGFTAHPGLDIRIKAE